MTDTVRVPREPTEAMRYAGDRAVANATHKGGSITDTVLKVWETMLAASPQREGSSADPAPIKPFADTGELRERVAAVIYDLVLGDEDGDVTGVGAATEAILDLIQSERGSSSIGQNDKPGLAFSDAGEP